MPPRQPRVVREGKARVSKLTRPSFVEIGASGLQMMGGQVQDEFLIPLQGRQGRRVYREMSDNDPVIGGILRAFEMLIRDIKWYDEPADDTPQADEYAQFITGCRDDMSMTWPATIASILTELPFGWSWHEILYKQRVGQDEEDGARRSRYDDNLYGWRKFALRTQESLDRWEFDPSGQVTAMVQVVQGAGGHKTIPIEASLLFRTTAARGNPEGRSLIRNSYRPWVMKKRIEEIEGTGIERDLAGLPIAYVPPELLSDSATAAQVTVRETIKNIVRDIKRDDQEGVLFPAEYDENGNKRYELALLTTGGRRQFDTDAIVGRYDQRIAISVLADFLLLGHEKVGSFNLGTAKIDLFLASLGALVDDIASIFTTYAYPRLMRLNGMDTRLCPVLKHEEIKEVDLQRLGYFITAITGGGVDIADLPTLNVIRTAAGFPALTQEDFDAQQQAKQERMLAMQQAAARGQVQPPAGQPPAPPVAKPGPQVPEPNVTTP
jgi:hypothetical protein